MSFKEIKELRQAGKLDEALRKASQALEADPDNIWNKRAAAWVYYDHLKKFNQPNSFDLFVGFLKKLRDLKLAKEENLVFDKSAWQIGSLAFAMQKSEQVDYGKLEVLIEIIRDFHFTKPSEEYSFLYKAFHKSYQNWVNYLDFADWWNFENLRPEDFLQGEFNGRTQMSIAEQAYIAYSKKLLEGIAVDSFGLNRVIEKEKINSFIPKLDALITDYPDYQYPPYFKAKLLLEVGSEENILSAFLPFARQKRNDFWVWDLMADLFSEEKDLQFACYCKALTLKTPEEFLVKLRMKFAEILIERKMYNEAKTEIQKIFETRERLEWKIPNQLILLREQAWYSIATNKTGNRDLYQRHSQEADEILFRDIPEEIIVVEFVNSHKNMLSFVKDEQKFGFFNYSRHLIKPQLGDLLAVRFVGSGQDGFFKILTAKKADSAASSPAIKSFKGDLKVILPQSFGFVQDNFIEPKMISDRKLVDGQLIRGRSILSFNKKKNSWGWKVIEIS